ncbi:MAG: hypothetical protein KGJ62_14195 [Armatimonadetes bacterium]|nr:hypothetical protein [Armatimonadota bacterium]MDE2207058.1 hypothetical protein [Armatimonadota bacterium]
MLAKTVLLVALGAWLSGTRLHPYPLGATIVVASVLWLGLYGINEYTDLTLEQRLQPAPFGLALAVSFVLVALLGSLWLSHILTLLLLAMVAGQLLYCVPPARVKRWWFAVVLLSGMANPLLRLECGATFGRHGIPISLVATVILLHVGATLRSRGLLRRRDAGFGYRVAPPVAEAAGKTFTALGLIGAWAVCLAGIVPPIFLSFVILATFFAAYAWSGRAPTVDRLRGGWIWFAIFTGIGLLVLIYRG